LREIERRLGIAELLGSRVTDERDPASTTHTYADMIRARLFAIACGYEDCDDLDALRFDPAFKLACGRLSETGDDLMSQPTLNASPLLVKLSDHLLGREIQINLGRSEVVMSEEPLQRRQRNISLYGGDGECVT
jgi:hypothetical protein